MGTTLHICVSCTHRKHVVVPDELKLRNCHAAGGGERLANWWNKLIRYEADPIPACDVYAGDHWSIASALPTALAMKGVKPVLWVISAGYGLIPAALPIMPYSATFMRGHPDSVVGVVGSNANRASKDWWNALGLLRFPGRDVPRSVTALAKSDPQASLLVVAGPHYVNAIEEDLFDALHYLGDRSQLVLITSRQGHRGVGLKDNILYAEAQCRQEVGGSCSSLNIRVARSLIERLNGKRMTFDAMKSAHARLMGNCQKLTSVKRSSMTNEEVRNFIKQKIEEQVSSPTALLRSLRESGLACEHKRFRRIYAAVKG